MAADVLHADLTKHPESLSLRTLMNSQPRRSLLHQSSELKASRRIKKEINQNWFKKYHKYISFPLLAFKTRWHSHGVLLLWVTGWERKMDVRGVCEDRLMFFMLLSLMQILPAPNDWLSLSAAFGVNFSFAQIDQHTRMHIQWQKRELCVCGCVRGEHESRPHETRPYSFSSAC